MSPKRPNEIDYLTGRISGTVHPPGISLPHGGGKFTTDGAVQIWPGNTFICHLDRRSESYAAILAAQEQIKKSTFQRFFAFLPPPSFHMTIFQGVSPEVVHGTGLPSGVPEGASRDEINEILLERLEGLDVPASFKVKLDGLFGGYSLTVSGADMGEERALRQARAALRDATKISFPEFDTYVFHITLAYLIDWVTVETAKELAAFSLEVGNRIKEEIAAFDLGPIEFCSFDSMHHFETVRLLAKMG